MTTSSKINITEAQWINRQPSELDYLRPNGFKFLIQSLPKVTYFCQSANIPALTLGFATQATPFVTIPRPGEKLDFGELTIKFLIQEDMSNYIELYNWIIALGFPESRRQFQERFTAQSFRDPSVTSTTMADGTPSARKTDATEYSDATLLVIDSDNLPIARLNFSDCFPTSLSGVDFDVSTGDTQYFAAQAVFKYRTFTVESLQKNT
jgi:hypothetical protein